MLHHRKRAPGGPLILAIIILLAPFAGFDDAAAQVDRFVLPNGSGTYPTIQDAIDAAQPGDRVILGIGTFTGDGNRDLDLLGKAITVRGQAADASLCIIDCQGSAAEPHRGFDIQQGEGSGTVIEYLTVRGGWADTGGAINIGTYADDGASPTIRYCAFDANRAGSSGGAIWATWYSDPHITHCLFTDNRAERYGGGFGSDFWSQPWVSECTFVGNACEDPWISDGGGVYVSATATYVVVAANIFWSNRSAMGNEIGSQNHGMIDLDCNDIRGGLASVHYENPSDVSWGVDNIDANPLFCDATADDFRLASASPCLPQNNECASRMGCFDAGCADVSDVPGAVVDADFLGDNRPNPFNPSTRIEFGLAVGGTVSLDIYDVSGRRVRRLLSGQSYGPGVHGVEWNGRDDQGRTLASGTYFCRFESEGFTSTRKMALLK